MEVYDPYGVREPRNEWEDHKKALNELRCKIINSWRHNEHWEILSGEIEEIDNGFAVSMVWRVYGQVIATTVCSETFQKALLVLGWTINSCLDEWDTLDPLDEHQLNA